MRSVLLVASLIGLGSTSVFAQEKPPLPSAVAVSAGPTWVHAEGGAVPPGARATGYEAAGLLYSCRAMVEGGFHPGKVRPGFDGCYVPVNGREQSVRLYEVLVGSPDWEIARGGDVPGGASEVGRTRTGQPLYACRAAGAAGELMPGRTGAGLRGCNIGVGGIEQTQ
ncbi:MAG: DUF3421 domain-containing protein, partial [Gemmatimonadales bacterium]